MTTFEIAFLIATVPIPIVAGVFFGWLMQRLIPRREEPEPTSSRLDKDFTPSTHWLPYRPPKGREDFHYRNSIYSVRIKHPE